MKFDISYLYIFAFIMVGVWAFVNFIRSIFYLKKYESYEKVPCTLINVQFKRRNGRLGVKTCVFSYKKDGEEMELKRKQLSFPCQLGEVIDVPINRDRTKLIDDKHLLFAFSIVCPILFFICVYVVTYYICH